jgi:hypothetical protein
MEAYQKLEVSELPPRLKNGVRAAKIARFNTYLLAILILIPFAIYYWPFYDPVDYLWIDAPKQVEAGGVLKYTIRMDKKIDLAPNISRYLVNADNPRETITVTSATLGGMIRSDTHKTVMLTVPFWVPPGKWYVRARVIYPYWGGNVPVERDYRTPIFDVVPGGAETKAMEAKARNRIETAEIKAKKLLDSAEAKKVKPFGGMKSKQELRKELYGK